MNCHAVHMPPSALLAARVRRRAENTSHGSCYKQKKTMSFAHGLFIGVTGFEPTTPSSLTKCASQLRYTPI